MESENQRLQKQLQQATAERESQNVASGSANMEDPQASRMPWRSTLGALWGERGESRPQPLEEFRRSKAMSRDKEVMVGVIRTRILQIRC